MSKYKSPAVRHVPELAHNFAVVLHQYLGPHIMAEVVERNATPEYDRACASHDFCDANMAMGDAWTMLFSTPAVPRTDRHLRVWNKAWELARSVGFDRDALWTLYVNATRPSNTEEAR